MSRVKRNLSSARMEQLMRERGLFTKELPEEGFLKTKEIPEIVRDSWTRKPAQPVPPPEKHKCPCEEAQLLSGTHKVDGGYCIDGLFWTDVEVNGMRHIKAMMGDAPKERKDAFLQKIALLKRHLDLDIEQAQVSPCS